MTLWTCPAPSTRALRNDSRGAPAEFTRQYPVLPSRLDSNGWPKDEHLANKRSNSGATLAFVVRNQVHGTADGLHARCKVSQCADNGRSNRIADGRRLPHAGEVTQTAAAMHSARCRPESTRAYIAWSKSACRSA